jgi:anti-anti-sigma factor
MPARHRPDRLIVSTETRDRAVVVTLAGELDAGTMSELERALTAVGDGYDTIVFDLRELQFVDSLGLNLLFRERARADERNVRLRMVRAPVHVQRLLTLAALDGTLGPFYPDPDAALRA